MLIYAIVFITLALVFYTIGVWSEKLQGTLKPWHLGLFLLGLLCDTTGTLLMESIASSSDAVASGFNLHGITGVIAIALMLIHAIWAAVVLIRKDENMISKFHKFSIIVWIIWLLPFLSGAMSHMN
ncbi:TIGR03987 family protein [Clostridium tagluense]|uniref:HsmA family protein n=1 Tax=Clostridium tagluense TaxID=360422 RepID=UPI001C0C87BA|nr:HsmA family protein [Clostridium tagluense]MBU3129121.1 TIGR03987 family protein [Clostridium tagluense]MCB2311338.1 TIGR03987 family protein [Clostridium tagluense]MCB2316020.1 TIGR03987 family protein [Clostridium tagluense]MCB2320914.1 TIGR03987 family protein [Clostridium tagluense]MCB2325889.1 TIGR03987 family protein [Clostridium tagluense]